MAAPQTPMSDGSWLNPIPEVGQRLNVSRSTVYKEMDSGRLPSVKVGRRRLVTEQALRDYIARLSV